MFQLCLPLPFWNGLCLFFFFPLAKQTVPSTIFLISTRHSVVDDAEVLHQQSGDDSWSIPGLTFLAKELCIVSAGSSLHSMLVWGRRLHFIDSCCVPPCSLFQASPRSYDWESMVLDERVWCLFELSCFCLYLKQSWQVKKRYSETKAL